MSHAVPGNLGNTANEAAAETKAHLKKLQAVEKVVLRKELAEALRWREVTWSRIPPLMRKLTLPFLTLQETLSPRHRGLGERRGERARPLDQGLCGSAICWLRRVGLHGHEDRWLCGRQMGEKERD